MPGRFIGGEAKGRTGLDVSESKADFAALEAGVDDEPIIQPGLEFIFRDHEPHAVPLAIHEVLRTASAVVAGVLAVDAGDTHERAAPAAQYKRCAGIEAMNGEGEGGEEVLPLHTPRFKADLVIRHGELFTGPGVETHATHGLAGRKGDFVGLDRNGACIGYGGWLPVRQQWWLQEADGRGLGLWSARGQYDEREQWKRRLKGHGGKLWGGMV